MAFTTINGASATDRVSFVGTDGVDILTTFNTLTAFVGAQGANDSITVSNPAGLIDWQVKAGAGNDTIDFNSEMIGGRLNGNAGVDTINLNRVVADAAVYGGQQDDFITTGDVANSRVNGNLGNDTITIGAEGAAIVGDDAFVAARTQDLIFASIFGGQGADTINVVTSQIRDTEIGGNLGNDVINLRFNTDAIVENVTVSGGEGDDVLAINGYLGGIVANTAQRNGGEGVTFLAGEGADTVRGSGRNDTIDGGAGNDFIRGRNGADDMSGGLGEDTFAYGVVGNSNGDAAAQTIDSTGATINATDKINDWARDTAVVGNNGDTLQVAVRTFLNDTAAVDVVTGATLNDVIATATAAYNGTALAGVVAADQGVWLAAVGNAGSFTAYAIIVGADSADGVAGTASIGAVQLGLEGSFTSANINTALTADQIAAALI